MHIDDAEKGTPLAFLHGVLEDIVCMKNTLIPKIFQSDDHDDAQNGLWSPKITLHTYGEKGSMEKDLKQTS